MEAVPTLNAVEGELRHRYVFTTAPSSDPSSLAALLERAPRRSHISVILEDAQLGELTGFLQDPRVNHIIVGDELDRGVFVTAQKLLTGDIFGLEKYLPQGTDVHYIRLRDFEGRGKAIDRILAFAEESKLRRQVRTAIGQVCEELLMNALYDAPVDEGGRQLFAEVDPHDRTKTQSPRPVSIRYAATEEQFAIAVRDRFGRLAKNTILAYIEKCISSPVQIDRKKYGAGLGLYLVANAAASYVVNVAYGVATEVICTFNRRQKAPLRLLGVFVHPGQADKLETGPTPEDHRGADESAEGK